MRGSLGSRLAMFSNEDLKCLNPEYFNIITKDAYDVTVMSSNTGHYWYLYNPEYPEQGGDHILLTPRGQIRESKVSLAQQGKHLAAGGTEHTRA